MLYGDRESLISDWYKTCMLDFITWTADLLSLPSIPSDPVDGLAFALGFAIGYRIVERMGERQLPPAWIDSLLIYTMLGTVIGARLGHCLFYAPDYYLANPVEILKIWEGGLASHGGTLGITIAIYFFSKRVSHRSMMWTFDKLVVPTGLVAAMIRLGNLMNHEIYGHPTINVAFRLSRICTLEAERAILCAQPSERSCMRQCYLLTFALVCGSISVGGLEARTDLRYFMICCSDPVSSSSS